jgi:hypothetical protein
MASLILISGCASINVLNDQFESYVVLMEEDSGTLEILSEPQGWEANVPGKEPGYVGFAPNKHGIIVLSLNESFSTCATGADWVITKIELSKNGNPATQKGNNFGSNQKGWLTTAFPQANDNGVVRDVSKDNGSTSFVVGNQNNNRGRQMAYYQVTATKCADGEEVTTDPGWNNGGRD